MLVLQSFSFLNISHISTEFWSRLRSSHFGHRQVVVIIVSQNVSHKVSTTFLLHLRSTVDSFHRGEGLQHALVAVGMSYMPPLSSTSVECSGQRPLWKNRQDLISYRNRLERWKVEKSLKKKGSKRTNQKLTKFLRRPQPYGTLLGFKFLWLNHCFHSWVSLACLRKKEPFFVLN